LNAKITARLAISCLALAGTSAYAVDYNTTADYVSISFEAEEYVTKDERWVLTDASTGQLPIEEDPDGNHSDTASGGVYFEILPDIRVTHEDPMSPPVAYWGQSGQGPQMTWSVNVPEPGRYYVHGRAFSTGTEDNGLHVGIDNSWPASGRMMQFCTANLRRWAWSSAQRDAGGVGSCGIQKSLYLDIDTAGPHTIKVSGREDGFELDKIVLIKDLSGNTKTCSPSGANGINCQNGGIALPDEQTDVSVKLETDPVTIAEESSLLSAGSTFSVAAIVENQDQYDVAEDITITTEFAPGLAVTAVPADCTQSGQTVSCSLASLEPTAPDENHTYVMDVLVLDAESDSRSIETTVANTIFDGNMANDTATIDVMIAVVDLSTDISVELALERDGGTDDLVWTVGELGAINLLVSNDSANDATNVMIDVQVGEGMDVDLLPSECSGTTTITCSFPELMAGQSSTLRIDVSANDAGAQVIAASASTANDGNSANNNDTLVALIKAQSAVTGENPSTPGSSNPDASVGGVSWQALLALLLLASAGVYWRHQRQPIPVAQPLSRERGSDHH